MSIDAMIAVLQAAKDGKQIQYRKLTDYCGAWNDSHASPYCNFADYVCRVKPEPREWLVPISVLHANRYNINPESGLIKVREVLE